MKIRILGLVLAGIMVASTSVQAAPVLGVTSASSTVTIASVSDSPFDIGGVPGLELWHQRLRL